VVRVTLTTLLGYLFALWLPPHIGIDAHWGAVSRIGRHRGLD
jgi:hypothetical protein